MTRYMGERDFGKALAAEHEGIQSLAKRPAPVITLPTGAVEGVILFAWNYITDNTVTTVTWGPSAAAASNKGYYNEAFEFPFNSSFGWDFNTGTITNATDGLYVAHAFIQYNEDANVGESRAIAINHGSSLRYVNEIYCATATGVANNRLTISESWLVGFGSYSASVECWHNHGSNLTIRDAQFSVFLMGLDVNAAQFSVRP